MKHVNIPVFIPHLGCPNDCVFCNQKRISGTSCFNKNDVDNIIKNALSTVDTTNYETEIAFFGGSFTGIDRNDMIYLLETAYKYIKQGFVTSIRLSTRPDYIDEEILDILQSYRVKNIELGLQSMDDEVLKITQRGHTSEQARKACKLIKKYGFNLIGQMMIGLPGSTLEKEINTAEIIANLCDGARVYPTVVLRETELCDMAKRGEYTPLRLDDTIERTGEVLLVFDKAKKPVIRIGLQSGDELYDPDVVYGGDYHPAIGELAENYVYYKRICEELNGKQTEGKDIIVYCSAGCVSKVIGQKKTNKINLTKNYNIKSLKIVEKNDIKGYNIILDIL
ncbi:MAG: radical SAM protein [Clostridia bacterium]|nr:radical SAM protein [Clostridia bacterium]